ncbi:MAG TPA: Stp1/IreP family PP2C-type Ser/Thr phosphatase [Ilumatobacter sp.]|nr:Stp1/IreP family PP2C-type Ser/Thr phosphatase [Ilumatobacter sp.]
MANLRWGSATHVGQLRAQNEDNLHASGGVFVVADGMGGHLAGEIASEIAVNRLSADVDPATATLDTLVAAVNDANSEIYDGSIVRADQAGMGTTITAIAVVNDPHDGEVFGVANVGDSRTYVVRHQRLRQVTIDHSFVQELVAEGAISRDEARFHPRRNIVTRALGIEPAVRVDSWTMPIIRNDRFLLCSDGLVDEVGDDVIESILLAHPDDPDAAAQALIDAANEAGGRDNITVVIVDVLDGDDPPDPTQEFDIIPVWREDEFDNTGEGEIVSDPPDAPTDAEFTDDSATEPETDAAADAAIAADLAALVAETDATMPRPTPPADVTIETVEHPAEAPIKRRRGGTLVRFLLTVGVAAVIVLGFALLAAWARGGYFVAFNDADEVVVYQGRKETVLWFNPTEETKGEFTRDELEPESILLVEDEQEFSSLASAERFVAERLSPLEPDDSDPTPTTVATTTSSTPATSTTVRASTGLSPGTTSATTTTEG